MKPGIRSALLVVAMLAPGSGAAAHRALLGGFRPVASEHGARAVWVNPAAVGVTGRGTAVAELIVNGDEATAFLQSASEDDWALPTDVKGFSIAASTDRLAYGFQSEIGDEPGVPAWTFSVGNGVRLGGGGRIGATAEWRGGDDGGLDGSAGALIPLGRQLTFAAVARDVLARDVDGAAGERTWQLGTAIPLPTVYGTFTWDTVLAGSDGPVHWLAFSLDRGGQAHFSLARSFDGDWNATLDLVFPNHLFGIGAVDRDGGAHPDRAFVAAEWSARRYPGT